MTHHENPPGEGRSPRGRAAGRDAAGLLPIRGDEGSRCITTHSLRQALSLSFVDRGDRYDAEAPYPRSCPREGRLLMIISVKPIVALRWAMAREMTRCSVPATFTSPSCRRLVDGRGGSRVLVGGASGGVVAATARVRAKSAAMTSSIRILCIVAAPLHPSMMGAQSRKREKGCEETEVVSWKQVRLSPQPRPRTARHIPAGERRWPKNVHCREPQPQVGPRWRPGYQRTAKEGARDGGAQGRALPPDRSDAVLMWLWSMT
jgi:hypothetical protein